VFAGSGAEWGQQQELTSSDGSSFSMNWFGSSVSLDGETALVGATWWNSTQGAAYAFTFAPFFSGEVFLGGSIYYLQFPDANLFGYYGYLSSSIFYHQDMGYEAFIPSTASSVYFYDFASLHWWYTSASLFPYLYDFTLNTWIYYFPNAASPGHYTTDPRYFSNLTTGLIFTM
jgi:hypothetical protein